MKKSTTRQNSRRKAPHVRNSGPAQTQTEKRHRYRYSYQAEKLSSARSCLMLPHLAGEAQSIANAFTMCKRAFREMDRNGLDDSARQWVRTIEECMDDSNVEALHGEGTHVAKARTLSPDQQRQLSRAVDELAHWFRADME